jgi:Ca2+-binding EF-hand superfamily protein
LFIEENKRFTGVGDEQFWSHVFALFDHDHNEQVSFGEWIVVLSTITRGTVKEKLDWLFHLFDLDNDGQITRDELLFILRFLAKVHPDSDGRRPSDFVDLIFDKWDVDKDGSLSKAEFIAGFTHFKHLNDSVILLNRVIAQAFTGDVVTE